MVECLRQTGGTVPPRGGDLRAGEEQRRREIGPGDVGAAKVGPEQVGAGEVGVPQVGTEEQGAAQARTDEVPQAASGEIGVGELEAVRGAHEIGDAGEQRADLTAHRVDVHVEHVLGRCVGQSAHPHIDVVDLRPQRLRPWMPPCLSQVPADLVQRADGLQRGEHPRLVAPVPPGERVVGDVLARTEAVFAGPGTFFRRLEAGLHSFAVGLMAPLSAGNHAQELFDVNMALAADVSEQAKQRFLQLIRKAVTQAAATGEIRLGVDALANLLHAAMHGFKQADGDIPALERRITLFVALLATALGNPPPPARTAQRRRRIA